MANEPQTLEQLTKQVTNEPVATASHNLKTLVDFVDKKLSAEPIHTQGAVLQMLQTLFQHRQQATQMAIEEHKYHAQKQMQAAQEKAQAASEKANAPKLVTQ